MKRTQTSRATITYPSTNSSFIKKANCNRSFHKSKTGPKFIKESNASEFVHNSVDILGDVCRFPRVNSLMHVRTGVVNVYGRVSTNRRGGNKDGKNYSNPANCTTTSFSGPPCIKQLPQGNGVTARIQLNLGPHATEFTQDKRRNTTEPACIK